MRKSRSGAWPSGSRRSTGSESEIVTIPYEMAYGEGFDDMPRRVPDLTKVGRLIGYRPTKSLDQILESVIAFFRDSP